MTVEVSVPSLLAVIIAAFGLGFGGCLLLTFAYLSDRWQVLALASTLGWVGFAVLWVTG